MRGKINSTFLITSLILIILGELFLATLSAPASLKVSGGTNYYLFHQLFAIGIGLVVGIIAFKIPLHFLKKISGILLIINVALLIIVFLPFLGTQFWGAKRWISIGGNTFQPSEFFKITVILYLSAWLSGRFSPSVKKDWITSAKRGYSNLIKVFLPFLFLLSIIVVILYFQKDASTLGIIIISLLAIYFASGTPLWHTLLTLFMGVASASLLIWLEPYRMQRFLVFLRPETDPLGIGFQLKQSLLAIGSGGIFGKGLGMSTQKFGYLPQAMSDSVFAIIGEETGIIGCAIVIILIVSFFWQSLRISRNATDTFSKLAAVGIGTWILTQSFMNIASSIGVFPLSGIPLPFFSYGGSHIITEIAAVGLLLNISKNG